MTHQPDAPKEQGIDELIRYIEDCTRKPNGKLFVSQKDHITNQITALLEADRNKSILAARKNEVGLIDMGDVEYPRKRLEALQSEQRNLNPRKEEDDARNS